MPNPQDFVVNDCALVPLATGVRAQNLPGLRDGLLAVPADSVYYHFWGGLLRARFDDPEFNNDFAVWARHALHDLPLAERLAVIDPADFVDAEALRQEVLEVVEQRLDEIEVPAWAPRDRQFHFMRGQLVVFDTGRRLHEPRELVDLLPQLSAGSVFYHLIDARRREPPCPIRHTLGPGSELSDQEQIRRFCECQFTRLRHGQACWPRFRVIYPGHASLVWYGSVQQHEALAHGGPIQPAIERQLARFGVTKLQ